MTVSMLVEVGLNWTSSRAWCRSHSDFHSGECHLGTVLNPSRDSFEGSMSSSVGLAGSLPCTFDDLCMLSPTAGSGIGTVFPCVSSC